MRVSAWVMIGTILAGFAWTDCAGAAIEPPVLRVSSDTEPLSLDWNDVRTGTDRFIASFLMRGLLKYDSTHRPVCDLCQSYSVSADGKVLRFELRSGVEWSDGTPLEARHFVDSFDRLRGVQPGVGDGARVRAGKRFKAAEAFRDVLAVRADGKHRLEITLARPLAVFDHLLTTAAVFPIRKELLRKGDSGEHHASTAVLGPYQLAAWEHGKRLVIEGNPRYKGERPVYRVDFVLGTHAQLLARFQAGKLDILSNPTGDDLLRLPGQRLQVNPYWAVRSLVLNVRRGALVDARLRRALLHALDRDNLPAFLRNGERRVTGLIPPGLPGYRELPLVTPDAALASKERAQAVSATAKSVELVLLARDLDADRRVVEWVAAQLERLQVRIKPQVVSASAYVAELEKGRFDLALGTWTFDVASPLPILQAFETASVSNRGGWTHVGFDALLGQLARETDGARFSALVDQLTQIIEVKDPAVIPIGYPTQPFVLGPRVVSFAITPFGDPDLVRIRLKM